MHSCRHRDQTDASRKNTQGHVRSAIKPPRTQAAKHTDARPKKGKPEVRQQKEAIHQPCAESGTEQSSHDSRKPMLLRTLAGFGAGNAGRQGPRERNSRYLRRCGLRWLPVYLEAGGWGNLGRDGYWRGTEGGTYKLVGKHRAVLAAGWASNRAGHAVVHRLDGKLVGLAAGTFNPDIHIIAVRPRHKLRMETV